jgi:hypothetical protein
VPESAVVLLVWWRAAFQSGVTVNRRCGVEWNGCRWLWTHDGVVDDERRRVVVGLRRLTGLQAGEAFEPTRRAKPADEIVKRQCIV